MTRQKLIPFLWSCLLACQQAAAAGFVVRNAVVVDGTGAAAQRVDVRITGNRIAAIGRLSPQRGEQVIDAHGLVLAPGFIDTHSHHDGDLKAHPDALPVVSQGVTTIVIGQDGFSDTPLAESFRQREASPVAINIASYSGHNTLREKVMGKDFKHAATPAQVEAMRRLLVADMKAGALGLSTGLEYDPGLYSTRAEVLALARAVAPYGGRYISHMRSEDRHVWEALDELLTIGREAKIPVQVSHAKLAMTDWWGQADRFLGLLDKARADGVEATLDVYPYDSWHSELIVLWPERDFENRATAEFVLKHLAPADGLRLSSFAPDPSYVGKTVADIARLRGTDEPATVMALIRESQAANSRAQVVSRSMDERDIDKFVTWPNSNICSDGSIDSLHPRGIGTFPRVLRVYVREKKLLTLEQAVHKMTSVAARHMGFRDRGEIRVGAAADLVLFDPQTVADRATYDNPREPSVGIERVWVNGTTVFEDGKATGAHPGQVLRRRGTH
ncbi:MAG: D-aminoacylase [Proteobacteria bacterium]|nr:D-aminoacylase [Pseudomonadota bacterium]